MCDGCTTNCKFIPGYLIPSDLERMIPKDADPFEWARENLRASSGAVLMNSVTKQTIEIPTLVPASHEDLSCKFLDEHDRCTIHANAPFGCAFFDCKKTHKQADVLSKQGLTAIVNDCRDPTSLYVRILQHLIENDLIALAPNAKRRAMGLYLATQESRRRKMRPKLK
jgi:Fe-S-cluster containining protein